MEPTTDITSAGEFLADAARIIERFLEIEEAPPAPPLPVEDAAARFDLELPARGVGDEAALERLLALVEATPPTAGPRFVNQLFAGRERVATAADMIASALNTSMYTYKAAGPQILVERALLMHMLDKAGMTGGDGMFTPGGSLSNLAAMIIARNEMVPGAREDGLDARGRIVYVSAESHYSIRKNANMIGVGRSAVRPVAVDARGRMLPDALEDAIRADRAAGRRPMMIVATSGTTVMGAFDPLAPLADIAQREELWLHVDGAFGGTALLHERTRPLLDGLDRADSFTWDAHKTMGVPLTCSVVLTRKPGLMRTHFDETAPYLFQHDYDDEQAWINPGVKSLQCGRRNDAIKLWAQWQALGDAGYTARVEKQLALARTAADIVRSDDRFVLSCEPDWLTVCFEVRGKPSDEICDALNRSGELKVGYGIVHGRRVIRLATINPSHSEGDIERMMADIAAAAAGVDDADNSVN